MKLYIIIYMAINIGTLEVHHIIQQSYNISLTAPSPTE